MLITSPHQRKALLSQLELVFSMVKNLLEKLPPLMGGGEMISMLLLKKLLMQNFHINLKLVLQNISGAIASAMH